ncbi:uncharacterized protein LOC135388260 [Ornithodoros turicata]|uniref:uncharacterized protein LOC135388260 n=1 Tax=Ornithodoros turicata TaxID=34597 RepID=UPI003138C11E
MEGGRRQLAGRRRRRPATDVVNKAPSSSGFYIGGKVNGQHCKMLIDTGATISLISSSYLKELPKENLGIATVILSIAGQDFQRAVHVASVVDQCILGIEFMKEYGCIVNLCDGTLLLGQRQLILGSCKVPESGYSPYVICRQTVLMEPFTEIIVPRTAQSKQPSMISAIEPCPGGPPTPGILVARGLVRHEGGVVPVRVLNVTPSPIVLHKGQRLAKCSQITELLFNASWCPSYPVYLLKPADIDEIIVHSRTLHQHLDRLRRVRRLCEANLKLNPKKCNFLKPSVVYLGHLVSANGVQADSAKSLNTGQAIRWSPSCNEAFPALKSSLMTPPVLAFPMPDAPFILDRDASQTGIGVVLSQVQDGQDRMIACFSRSLRKPERNYCVTRKELLAVVKSVQHIHHYLYGRHFTLTFYALQWLLTFRNPEGQVARWLQTLQEYDFTSKHRRCVNHANADGLSRIPCSNTGCGRCTQHLALEDNPLTNSAQADYSQRRTCAIGVDITGNREYIRMAQDGDPNIGPVKGTRPLWPEVSR